MVTHTNKFCQFLYLFVSLGMFLHITGATHVLGSMPGLGNVSFKCMEKERQALFHLKDKLVDNYGILSSWTAARDCCKWKGVHCDNRTGHVTVLDFRGRSAIKDDGFSIDRSLQLRGTISPSLLELKHLTYLDLSFIDFDFCQIPQFLGSLSKLQYLNLSYSYFSGSIPHQIRNLSHLQFLDLGYTFVSSKNLDWLSNLHSLRYLDLSQAYLHRATNWLQAVGNLPLLQELILSTCGLPQILAPPFSLPNSSASLAILDLSSNSLSSSSVYTWLFNFSSSLTHVELQSNNLQGNIPQAFSEMTSLVHLNLSHNHLEGGITRSFGNLSNLESLDFMDAGLTGQLPELMKNLSGLTTNKLRYLSLASNKIGGLFPDVSRFSALTELTLQSNQLSGFSAECCSQHSNLRYLDLSANQISGPLPDLAKFQYLREIYLGYNQFNGPLPESIGSLSQLEILSLPSNHLEGIISESHFFKLSQLKTLSLSFNPLLVLNFSYLWFPPFQLNVLQLSFVKLGPWFPKWLLNQRNITYLDISGAGISDTIPNWFWDKPPSMTFLNLSHNHIHGMLPNLSSRFSGTPRIDLSFNNLTGPLPSLPPNILFLDLSVNKFLESISVLCRTSGYLTFLDISNNLLTGEFPSCLTDRLQLTYLNFANNHLSGKIPHSICSWSLKALHLQNNNFTGEIPKSLSNCDGLRILDLGGNNLSGEIASLIQYDSSNLVLLNLRSNEFHGNIPSNLCLLRYIQILDLSMNKFSGTIPKCFSNLTAMAQEGRSFPTIQLVWIGYRFNTTRMETLIDYSDGAFVVWKGIEVKYRSTLGLVKIINLSNNNLTGEIPSEISSLAGLLALNLSTNSLSGSIPSSFGELRLLNSLDLSRNQLSGGIPSNLTQLSHLGVLNLSYNNLSGKIPSGPHLETFDNSSYIGNSGLCGSPLTKACRGDEVPSGPKSKDTNDQVNDEEHEDKFIDMGFYISLAFGFIFGFWGVFGTFVLKPLWRYKFFHKIEDWLM